MKLPNLKTNHIKDYLTETLGKGSASTYERKLASLKKFFNWAEKEGYITGNPLEEYLTSQNNQIVSKINKAEENKVLSNNMAQPFYSSLQNRLISRYSHKPKFQNFLYKAFYSRPKWYQTYHSLAVSNYLHLAILMVFSAALAFGAYDQLKTQPTEVQAFPTSLVRPSRYLSFQGRLTNQYGNPITVATDVVFKLHTAATSGSELWTSGTCSVTPDPDGIFSTVLGSTCGIELGSSIFSENSAVWLSVKVGTDAEATPRIQIATVAYALNTETLQGYPASASAVENNIPVIDNSGNLIIGVSSPKIKAISESGAFVIEGQTGVTLSATDTSNSSININPDGTGTLNLTFEGVAPGGGVGGFINATNANITSGSLYFGQVASDATGYDLIQLKSGSTPTEKFAVDNAGNADIAGDLAVNGDDITGDASTLTFNVNGASAGQIVLADTDTLNIGGLSGYAYNSLASGTDAKDEAAVAADNDLYIGGDLEVDGTIYAGSLTATSLPWSGLTDPATSLTLAHGVNATTMGWIPTGDLNAWTMNLTNNGGSSTTQNAVVINNAVAGSFTDVATENLLLVQQLDTTTAGTTVVTNGVKIDSAGSSAMTNGLTITNSAGNLTTGINIADTANGTLTTGITISGTVTNAMDAGAFPIVNIGNANTDFNTSGGLTLAENLVVQGTTGLTFNTGAGGDITFANGEKIDNDTDGTIALTATTTALSGDLKLTGADILDTNGNEFLRFTSAASAVNELTVANAATGGVVTLAATGGDTDIALSIDAKGADAVNIAGTSTGGVNIAGSGTGDVNIAGGSGTTGCTVTNSTGALTCSGSFKPLNGLILDPAGTTAINLTTTPTSSYNALSATVWKIDSPGTGGNPGLPALTVNQGTAADIFRASATDSAKFVITNAGNVGIGTTVPTTSLAFGGDVNRIIQMERGTVSSTDGYDLSLIAGGTTSGGTDKAGGDLYLSSGISTGTGLSKIYFQTAGSEIMASGTSNITPDTKMTITGTGRVGIGTTDPGAKLDVDASTGIGIRSVTAGTYGISGSGPSVGVYGSTTTGYGIYGFTSGSNAKGVYAFNNGDSTSWDFYGAGSKSYFAGNVGIGATSPVYKLDVTGTTRFSGSIINTTGSWNALGDQGSMVPNSGFEVNEDSDATIADAWSVQTSDSGTDPNISTTSQQGVNAQRMYATTTTSTIIRSICLPITGGTSYNLYAWVRSTAASTADGLTIRLNAYDGTDCTGTVNYYNAVADGAVTSTYTKYGGTVTPASTKRSTYVVLRNYQPATTTYMLFDSMTMVPAATTDTIDLAENYYSNTDLLPGQIVRTQDDLISGVIPTETDNASNIIGIVSTNPAITLGETLTSEDKFIEKIALSGRVPTIVTTANGPIASGDHITSSSFAPGVGGKAIKPGMTIGTALESTNSWSAGSCQSVGSVAEIVWPDDDGSDAQSRPCFILPDGTYVGKIMVFVNSSWYDPDVYLASTGDLKITRDENNNYQLTNTAINNSLIDRIGAFGQLVAANIKAGTITTTDFIAENINAGAISVQSLFADSFTAFQGTVDNLLVSTGLVSSNIKTQIISPLADSNLVIDLNNSAATGSSSFGKLIVKGEDEKTVAAIDELGNATFSGTLYADQIVAKNGIFGDVKTASSSGITREEVEELLAEAENNAQDLTDITNSNIFTASSAANLNELAVNDLFVTGRLTAENLSLTQNLTLGPDLILQSQEDETGQIVNTLDTLSAPLSIQSLAMAPLQIMAGKFIIETNGDVKINGNLYLAGNIESFGLTLKPNVNNPESAFGKLLSIENSEGRQVAQISASGSATFNEVSTNNLIIAGSVATSSADIINGAIETNATVGQALIPANTTEVKIVNPKITNYTLVYVTPTSSTNNNVLYVKSKDNGYFTVGFINPVEMDVNFNWWIIDTNKTN